MARAFDRFSIERLLENAIDQVVDNVPFIDEDTYLSLLDKKYPINVSLQYDDSGIVIHEDRIEFAEEYTANNEHTVGSIINKLTDAPVLQRDKTFIVGNIYYQLVDVKGDEVTATLFATFDIECGWDFFWEEGHRIKVDDLSVGDAKRLGLI